MAARASPPLLLRTKPKKTKKPKKKKHETGYGFDEDYKQLLEALQNLTSALKELKKPCLPKNPNPTDLQRIILYLIGGWLNQITPGCYSPRPGCGNGKLPLISPGMPPGNFNSWNPSDFFRPCIPKGESTESKHSALNFAIYILLSMSQMQPRTGTFSDTMNFFMLSKPSLMTGFEDPFSF